METHYENLRRFANRDETYEEYETFLSDPEMSGIANMKRHTVREIPKEITSIWYEDNGNTAGAYGNCWHCKRVGPREAICDRCNRGWFVLLWEIERCVGAIACRCYHPAFIAEIFGFDRNDYAKVYGNWWLPGEELRCMNDMAERANVQYRGPVIGMRENSRLEDNAVDWYPETGYRRSLDQGQRRAALIRFEGSDQEWLARLRECQHAEKQEGLFEQRRTSYMDPSTQGWMVIVNTVATLEDYRNDHDMQMEVDMASGLLGFLRQDQQSRNARCQDDSDEEPDPEFEDYVRTLATIVQNRSVLGIYY
jgi:hypothetical protein